MRFPPRAAAFVLSALAIGLSSASSAQAGAPGGVQAPAVPQAGGSEYGVIVHASSAPRPVLVLLSVPRRATAGAPPRVRLMLQEPGVGTVHVAVVITSATTRARVLAVNLGWQHTGRTLTVAWPRGARLAPGHYQLRVGAHDHHRGTLLRRAHSSGVAGLTIVAPPAPAPPPSPPAPPGPEPGIPAPAQTVADGAVFPVSGPHSFGGPENRFGAPREGHVHEGQDVLTAEGTPVVAPLAGTVVLSSYQAGGAGYYAVEHTAIGFDFMFAHCQAGSLAVAAGQVLAAGAVLCRAGQTGDATGPHLHFEMWVGGWQAASGHPIDPLPYLQAWEAAAGG
jgi:hypothetical protein